MPSVRTRHSKVEGNGDDTAHAHATPATRRSTRSTSVELPPVTPRRSRRQAKEAASFEEEEEEDDDDDEKDSYEEREGATEGKKANTKQSSKKNYRQVTYSRNGLDVTDAKSCHRSLIHALQLPAIVVTSFAISSVSYGLLRSATNDSLNGVARELTSWDEVGLLAAWRVLELTFGWFGQLDSLDLAALSVLSHGPPLFLLNFFYDVQPAAIYGSIVIDSLAAALPLLLFRSLSLAHSPRAQKSVPNGEILFDIPVQLLTILFASVTYSVVLFLSFKLILPTTLVLYFHGVVNITAATQASYLSIFPVALLFGFAAKSFLFTPYVAVGRSENDAKLAQFDPVESSLGETVKFNLWGYTSKNKVLIVRTLTAVFLTAVNTYTQCVISINGVECTGAIIYASIWVSAVILTSIGINFVGNV